jgi:hypothetical protein
MLGLLIVIGRALALGLRGHRELVLENLALRQQLMAMKRAKRRPHLQARDRLFWIAFGRIGRRSNRQGQHDRCRELLPHGPSPRSLARRAAALCRGSSIRIRMAQTKLGNDARDG